MGKFCFRIEYLFGEAAVKPYRYIFIIFVGVGAVAKLDFVWSLSDTFNGLMAITNLIGQLALSPVIVKETRDYFSSLGAINGNDKIQVTKRV